ncbi:MAG: STAS domain-containing protein [Rubripirellula sp.]
MAIGFNAQKTSHTFVGQVDNWLRDAKCDAENSESPEVIVDLSDVTRVSSHDLNELIRLQLHIKNGGQRLVLSNVQETVFQVFTLTRLDRLIELRHDGHFETPEPHGRR